MSGEERTYWPTSVRRDELRSTGEVPYSFLIAQCVATIAAVTAAYLIINELVTALSAFRVAVRDATFDYSILGALLIKIILFPALGVAFAVFSFGLLQTRFWIGTDRLGFDLSRIAPKLTVISPVFLAKKIVAQLFLSILLAAVTIGIAAWMARDLFPLLNADRTDFIPWLVKLVRGFTVAGAALIVFLMLCGFISSRLLFNLRHRMTKQEIEQESRVFGN